MKKLILITALLSLVGCAATPPKASVIVNNDSDIIISNNSSEALKELNSLGFKGVRDLTSSEFNRNKKDADLFEKSTGSKEGFNRLAYEAGGVGLGLAAGLSMGTVLGYGALTALTADDRPENYSFAWDFDGRIMVASKSGQVDSEKLHSAIISVMESLYEIYPDMFSEETDLTIQQSADGLEQQYKREVYNKKNKIKLEQEPVAFQRVSKRGTLNGKVVKPYTATTQSFCSDNLKECEIVVNVYNFSKGQSGMRLPQSNLILRLISAKLNEEHLLYLPLNKALYRLPMIVRGGTGEIEYLVEKE